MAKNIKLFDAHLHIIDSRFPLRANHGYLPSEYTCEDYLNRMSGFTVCGGAVVSGSFQAYDQSYLVDALTKLGPSYVGVIQLSETFSDDDLLKLNRLGVRAVRFNLKRGVSIDRNSLKRIANHIYEVVGWHVELYVDSIELTDLYHVLLALPAVSIDHLGLSKAGFSTLLKLVEKGIYIKASGFGRVDFDVRAAIVELYSANPKSLMFGTDLPSTRADKPFNDNDYFLIEEILEPDQACNIFFRNAIDLYRPKETH